MNIKIFNKVYSVNDSGEILNIKTNNKISIFIRNGYPCVALMEGKKQKIYYLHRLLALLFIDNPNKLPIINHKDGNKLNYSLSNLEWCNYSHNNLHAYKNKLNNVKSGEKSHAAKLKKEEVAKIRFMLKYSNMSQEKIANLFNVSRSCVQAIKMGKSWRNS